MNFLRAAWNRIKTVCMGSITMAWSYIVTAFGAFMTNVDSLAAVLGDPNLNQQVTSVIGDTKAVGKWMLTVGIVTAIARLKSLVKPKAGS